MLMQKIPFLGRRRRSVAAAERFRADGFVQARSAHHVAGWMMDPADPVRRLAYEVVDQATEQVLATGVADQYRHHLNWTSIGDAACGFHARLPADAPDDILVRPVGGVALPVSPHCETTFEPFLHVAMDIVDNCNLRCPFCIFDYANTRTTNFMDEQTLEKALRLLPYVKDGQFWFSCLHEPTLHPDLTAFIDRVPRAMRKKVFYTTNLAKRMPDSYFAWLAESGLYNINISIESRDPAIYERMRKGARHRIFQENWDKLLAAFARAPAPPKLRYIAMAYKSNVDELPDMARYLLEERQGWNVELRYTFDMPFIPAEFRAAEFLDDADWARLRARLPDYPMERLNLIAPPPAPVWQPPAATAAQDVPPAAEMAPPRYLPDYYMLRVSWDGTVKVTGILAESRHANAIEREILMTTLDEMGEPAGFLSRLTAHGA